MSNPGFLENFSQDNCNIQQNNSLPTLRLKMSILDSHSFSIRGSVPKIPEVFPGKTPNPWINSWNPYTSPKEGLSCYQHADSALVFLIIRGPISEGGGVGFFSQSIQENEQILRFYKKKKDKMGGHNKRFGVKKSDFQKISHPYDQEHERSESISLRVSIIIPSVYHIIGTSCFSCCSRTLPCWRSSPQLQVNISSSFSTPVQLKPLSTDASFMHAKFLFTPAYQQIPFHTSGPL